MKTLLLPRNITVDTATILYLESNSNYTLIYTKSENIVVARSLCHVFIDLETAHFIRINRSQVINKAFVKSFTADPIHSEVTLMNGLTFKTSRRRTEEFLNAI